MAIVQAVCNSFKEEVLEGTHVLLTDTLKIVIPARWTDIHRPVWPTPVARWNWPPPRALNDDNELRLFATRVATPRPRS